MIPLACDMEVIPPGQRPEHREVTRRLLASVVETSFSSDGVALRLPAESFETVTRFVEKERLCCPFLRFTVELHPAGGPLWLRLDGPPGAGEFLRAELGLPADP